MHIPVILRPSALYSQLARWVAMFRGKSKLHPSLALGNNCSKHHVNGYYIDFTEKCDWIGVQDADSIPRSRLSNGALFYFPIAIAQKALAHYERFLHSEENQDLQQCLNLCDWLVENQEVSGGWNCWGSYRVDVSNNYSSMAQGQVISALVRGYLATSRDRYRTAAESALNILDPKLSPAIAVQYKGGLVYEELPGGKNEKVLNGWIFTLFGLYDYFKCFGSDRAELLFRDSEFALRRQLMDYDTGYWSLYDQSGNMASPFYHQLHILLMKAMSGITGENGYLNMAEVWGAYQESSLFRYRSLVVKSVQKLLETKHLEIVE